MRVLGVDPGLTRCGIGVIDGGPGLPPRMVEVVVVRTPPGDGPRRAVADHRRAGRDHDGPAPAGHRRDRADVQPAQRAHRDGHRAGVRGRRAGRRPASIPVAWHTPSEVKAAVSGNGNADKAQVTAMITRLLDCRPPQPADAADALALALCHLWRSPMQDRLLAAAARRGWRHEGACEGIIGTRRPDAAVERGWAMRERAEVNHRHSSSRRGAGSADDQLGPRQVFAVHLDHAVIEVGGVGLAVRTTPATLAGLRRGEQATLSTNAGGPGGLADPVRLRHRRRPRTCSNWCSRCPGSGPKIALALLAVLDPDELRRALAAGDTATLTRAPGIGKKGAERLVLELKDKVGRMPGRRVGRRPAGVGVGLPWRDKLVRRAGRARLHREAGRGRHRRGRCRHRRPGGRRR